MLLQGLLHPPTIPAAPHAEATAAIPEESTHKQERIKMYATATSTDYTGRARVRLFGR